MNLFFNYSIDCETPVNTEYTGGTEREPFFHGPESWAFAESSVRQFIERMDGLGVRSGATLFVYPDVARHQKALHREVADSGIEVGLHLNGLRYSKLTGDQAKWLGAMSVDEQTEALRMGKEDLEDSLGRPVQGYRACYGSANSQTLGICDEVGFTWTSNASNRHRPEFHAYWSGSWRYAHHASAQSNLICGSLDLFEIPITVGIHEYYDASIRQPLDLRVESPPTVVGEGRKRLRAVISENLDEMAQRETPIRTIIGASPNTCAFNDTSTHESQNLGWVVQHTRDLAVEHDLAFTPANFDAMRQQGEAVDSY